MADEQIIIDIQVSSDEAVAAISNAKRQLADLKAEQKELDKALAEGAMSLSDYNKATAENTKAQLQWTNEIKANTVVLKANMQQEQANKDSLVAMRAELKQATTAYDNLSAAERNGAKGQAYLQHIQDLTAKITAAEEASGRFQRNVGNYKGAVAPVIERMDKLGGVLGKVGGTAGGVLSNGIKSATAAMKIMSATPLIAILGVVVKLISAVIGAMKSTQEATDKAAKGFAAFSAIGDGVTKVLQWLADKLAGVVAWLGNLLEKTGLLKDAIGERQQLLENERKTEEIEIRLISRNAKYRMEIAELNAKAVDKQNYTTKERLAFLDKAIKKEMEIADSERIVAEANERNIKKRHSLTQSNLDDLREEHEAEARTFEARTRYNEKLRENTRRRQALLEELAREEKEAAENVTESWEVLQEKQQNITNDFVASLNKAVAAATEAKTSLRDLGAEMTTIAKQQGNEAVAAKLAGNIEEYYKRSIQAARTALDALTIADNENVEDFVARRLEAQQKLQDAEKALTDYTQQQAAERTKLWQDSAKAIADVFGTVGDIFSEFSETNKAAAIAEAAMSLAQIYIQQGVAIANGIAQAMKLGWPASLPAIASVIGAVTAAIASTISTVKQAQQTIENVPAYAVGGLVQGAGTATSDSIPARLSNGEFVVNADATKRHLPELVRLNGGWGNTSPSAMFANGGVVSAPATAAGWETTQLVAQFAEAVAKIQPVVSVKEITKVQNRIKTKEL